MDTDKRGFLKDRCHNKNEKVEENIEQVRIAYSRFSGVSHTENITALPVIAVVVQSFHTRLAKARLQPDIRRFGQVLTEAQCRALYPDWVV
jgi:hypothetical protein